MLYCLVTGPDSKNLYRIISESPDYFHRGPGAQEYSDEIQGRPYCRNRVRKPGTYRALVDEPAITKPSDRRLL